MFLLIHLCICGVSRAKGSFGKGGSVPAQADADTTLPCFPQLTLSVPTPRQQGHSCQAFTCMGLSYQRLAPFVWQPPPCSICNAMLVSLSSTLLGLSRHTRHMHRSIMSRESRLVESGGKRVGCSHPLTSEYSWLGSPLPWGALRIWPWPCNELVSAQPLSAADHLSERGHYTKAFIPVLTFVTPCISHMIQ